MMRNHGPSPGQVALGKRLGNPTEREAGSFHGGPKARAVAALLLASGMVNTVMVSGRRARLPSGRNSAHC
jgi:hypothetical protein